MKNSPPINGTVKLCGRKIGIVKHVYSSMGVAEFSGPIFRFKGKPVWLSFFFYPFVTPLVKIIPLNPLQLVCKVFEKVSILIS